MTSSDTFAFIPTPAVVRDGTRPMQVCRVTMPEGAGADTRLELVREGEMHTWAGESLSNELLVPEAASPSTGIATLTRGDRMWTAEVAFASVRRWSVFLVNHSHTDIGFTHTYRDCIRVHVKNLRLALEAIEATADWPNESRMRWTVESAWQLQHYLRTYPEDRDRISRAVRGGWLEIEALYIHSYFDILSREQLVRSLIFTERMRHDLDIPITSAMICDVPGCAWSLVDLFAQSGITYLAMAPNNFIAPFHAQTTLQRPFRWQGPAGNRVLTWFTADPSWAYIEGARLGFWTSYEMVREQLPQRLAELETSGYPYDAVQFQLGSDNRPLRMLPATIAREWNARYLTPQIEIATTSQFFRHMESRYAEHFPVESGEWQSSWSETTLHYPHEAALSRRNHHTLAEWQGFSALAGWLNEAYEPPVDAIDDAFDASLLFDEHGGPKGIWLPRSEQEALDAIVQGFELFEQETIPAEAGREAALVAATGALCTGDDPVVVVWNLCSWERSARVAIDVPAGIDDPSAIDELTGDSVPITGDRTDGYLLYASGVPAFGFRRYRLVSSEPAKVAWPVPDPEVSRTDESVTISNERFALTADQVGVLTSLVDRRTGRELIDRTTWPGGNAFTRYVADPHGPTLGGDFNADRRLYDGIAIGGKVIDSGTVNSEDITTTTLPGAVRVSTGATIDGIYRWETEVALHDDWIEIENRLTWLEHPEEREMLYVVFPFALPNPEIRHAAQYAIVDPRRQTLSGSNHDTFAIQEWVDVWTDEAGVTVSSDDLPLVDYGGINQKQFHRSVAPESGVLAFRLAALHNAPPEPGSPWGRQPWLHARFAIRPHGGGFDPKAAHQFGEEQASPLVARTLPPRHPGEWRQSVASLVDLESETVIISGLKPADDGRGTIVRLWQSTGERAIARLRFPQHHLLAAFRTTPGEFDTERVDITGGGIVLELGPFEVVTIRCQVGH
ncbi:MAG TPA: glycoside hydrolase family 38 C-terminal domain-containing protein [Thermomicrobiales bacterium]|nr:glycoside hydrolase family 38 C-terminal domain-containing protein [Thermomicrobiales bacterium]